MAADQRHGPGPAGERRAPGPRRAGRLTLPPQSGPAETADEHLLAAQPHRDDFLHTDTWRALRIQAEFVEGFDALARIGPAVTVFGSARVRPDDPVYAAAQELGTLLARRGLAVITGGGPGVMEAANRGAQEGGGLSVGCNIELANVKLRHIPPRGPGGLARSYGN